MTETPPRKLTRKGQATRDRIVAAAAELIFMHGAANLTTEDVQQSANVSASQLYHYFADKQALVRAVVEHQTAEVMATQAPILSQIDSIAALVAWRDMVIARQEALDCVGGCPMGALASELVETEPELRELFACGFSRWEGAILTGLQAMQERGVLRADAEPEQLALALLAAAQGGMLLTQARRDTAALAAVLDAMIAHIASFATTGHEALAPRS